MKRASLRLKLTLWFSAALVLVCALTFAVVTLVSRHVLRETLRDDLIRSVEDNVDEVEYFASLAQLEAAGDTDEYIAYQDGYLEIDDDFLDEVNGVHTALYSAEGMLLYGENALPGASESYPCRDGEVQEMTLEGETYYLFDRCLEGDGLTGLWLRGSVAESRSDAPLSSIVHASLIALPTLVLLAITGGMLIAGRCLRPLRQMSDTAAQISGGSDLKKRIPVPGSQDELGRLAVTMNGMLDRLEESFEAEKQFSTDVSHELRTPVTVIAAQCEASLEGEHTPEEYRSAMRVIRRQCARMTRLIRDMMDLLRMENGTLAQKMEPVNLSELTVSVASDTALIREKNIALTCSVEKDVTVLGAPVLLTRLMNNLIANAYRYGRENGHITVTLRRREAGAELAVADDGIGVPPEEREKIFRRMYRAETARTGEGTGLGLAMALQIVRIHGGTIRVDGAAGGQGSVFTVLLPEREMPSK